MKLPRLLVPYDCPPPPPGPRRPARRNKTWLDSRTIIPADMPVVHFEGGSNIPSHVPLDVLDNRILIPRDFPVVPFPPELASGLEIVTPMDERVVVPPEAHLEPTASTEPFPIESLRDLVETDLFVTGDPLLLPEQTRRLNWDWLGGGVSVAFHVLLVILFLTIPGLLGQRAVNPIQEALDQNNLSYVYLPKNLKIPKSKPQPEKPSNKMKIDVGTLRRFAPPKPVVTPQQGPAPQPTTEPAPPQPPPQMSARNETQPQPEPPKPQPQPKLEPVAPAKPRSLILPQMNMSPGRALEQSLKDAAPQHPNTFGFSARIPPPPNLPGGTGAPGGNGRGYLSGSVQLLTPTEGVDFTSYIARMLAVIERNWYTLMPESARLGDQGRVMLRFRILRDGSVPNGNPILELTSGKQPLDRAALASITASNPFEPLPSAYTNPYIELRIIYLYNLPLPNQ